MSDSSPVEIFIEDSVKCENCLKRDVCVALRSIAQKYIEFQHGLESITTKFNINVTHDFNLSIIDCECHIDESITMIRN